MGGATRRIPTSRPVKIRHETLKANSGAEGAVAQVAFHGREFIPRHGARCIGGPLGSPHNRAPGNSVLACGSNEMAPKRPAPPRMLLHNMSVPFRNPSPHSLHTSRNSLHIWRNSSSDLAQLHLHVCLSEQGATYYSVGRHTQDEVQLIVALKKITSPADLSMLTASRYSSQA